jgi:hypothetical protein
VTRSTKLGMATMHPLLTCDETKKGRPRSWTTLLGCG